MAVTYTLTVSIKNKETSEITVVNITNGAGSSATIPDIEGTVSLNEVYFNRKVYSPNELIADVLVNSTPAKKDILAAFENQEAKFTITDGNNSQVFTEYFIHHVLVLRVGSASTYIRLRAYSKDYQLTELQYCRTFVAKRLGRDILMEGTKNAKKEGDIKIADYWINQNLAKRFPITLDVVNTKGKEGDYVGVTPYLQHRKWKDKDETDERVMDEDILPYLVQYNESFYDFVSRTANRCGEFLYFEEGKLHLGVHTTTAGLVNELKTTDCNEIYGIQLTYSNQPYFGRDEVSEDWTNNDDGSNWSVNWQEFDDDNDKEHIIKKDTDSLVYDYEVNEEPYHNRIFKKKFMSLLIVKNLLGGKFWWGVFAKILKETLVYNMIKNVIGSTAKEVYEAQKTCDGLQSLWEKNVYDEQKHINEQLQKKGEDKSESITPFVAQGHIISNSDYHLIRNIEEAASAQAMTFNLGSNIKFMQVGQVFKYDSTDYIVIQVKLKPRLGKPMFNTIDKETTEETDNMMNSFMQVVAVPLIDGQIYPPMHPKGHVRHAERQVAFVTHNGWMDPLQQGRVRIRYPWDDKNSTPSPWVRIVVPGATPRGGFYSEPSDDDEVLVDYEAGNVERPVVVGFLRNRDRNHVFLRGDMYMVSKNGHGIGFNDPVDSSLFFQGLSPTLKFIKPIFGAFAMLGWKAADGLPVLGSGANCGPQMLLNLTGGTTIRDAYGLYSINMSTDQRKVDINSPFGDVSINAFTGISISAPNGDISIKGKNVSIEAGNAVKIVSGTYINNGQKETFAKKGGGLSMFTMGAEILADYAKDAVQIVDLKLLRCLQEMFLHPVNGTMQIKSNNHLMLEAGKGKASLPIDRYKEGTLVREALDEETPENINDKKNAVESLVTRLGTEVDNANFYNSLNMQAAIVSERITFFDKSVTKCAGLFKNAAPTAKAILKPVWQNVNSAQPQQGGFTYVKGAEGSKYTNLGIKDDIVDAQKTNVNKLVHQAELLSMHAYTLYTLLKDIKAHDYVAADVNDSATQFYPTLNTIMKAVLKDEFKLDNNAIWTDKTKFLPLVAEGSTKVVTKTKLKRKIFAKTLDAIKGNANCMITTDKTLNDDCSNWAVYLSSIEFKPLDAVAGPGAFKTAVKAAEDALMKPFSDWKDFITRRDKNVWSGNNEGQIIFTDKKGFAFYFDEHGSFHKYITSSTWDLNTIKKILNNY